MRALFVCLVVCVSTVCGNSQTLSSPLWLSHSAAVSDALNHVMEGRLCVSPLCLFCFSSLFFFFRSLSINEIVFTVLVCIVLCVCCV